MSNNCGEFVRKLRKERRYLLNGKQKRLSIEQLAADAGLDYRTMLKIETGQTGKPSWDTLSNIANALSKYNSLSADERIGIFECYGYTSSLLVPTDEEKKQAEKRWRDEYRNILLPMYLVDFTQRLIAWNEYAPKIIGLTEDSALIKSLKGITVFDLAFNPQFIAASRIVNADEFLPNFIKRAKAEMQDFRGEDWYKDLIDSTCQNYPLFKQLWESFPEDLPRVFVRQHGPIQIRHPNGAILQFKLLGIDFISDPRFRVVQYYPIDPPTMAIWNSWISGNDTATEFARL